MRLSFTTTVASAMTARITLSNETLGSSMEPLRETDPKALK